MKMKKKDGPSKSLLYSAWNFSFSLFWMPGLFDKMTEQN